MQSSEIKSSIPKLQTDGSNWVTYRDRLVLALESLGLDIHLTNDDAPKDYGAKGDINGLDAATRWKRGESGTKQLIAATVPEAISKNDSIIYGLVDHIMVHKSCTGPVQPYINFLSRYKTIYY